MSAAVDTCADDAGRDASVWAKLHEGYVARLARHGTAEVEAGFAQLGLGTRIEAVETVGLRVRALTGWRLEAVDGMICERDFFSLLDERRFPIASAMRSPEELDFSRLPDRFHDIFGHTTLLGNAIYCDFLAAFADAARRHIERPRALQALMRVYWYVIECGLAMDRGERRAFGAAILTSRAECDRAMSAGARVSRLELETVAAADYDSFTLQPHYFLLGCFDDLRLVAHEIATRDWSRA